MDSLLFNAFERSLGNETRERIRKQVENYDYYDGKQHKDIYGALVRAEELERPADVDYDPTRYATNYFKAIINRKARWQMGGEHGIQVPRKSIDNLSDTLTEGYEPSEEQLESDMVADGYERTLYSLWRENKMRSSLVKAARDRLIADRAVCKIVFNQRTGKLRWIWRPDTEFIPIYSDDDFEDMIACHFVRQKAAIYKGEEVHAIQKQTYRIIDGMAYVHEAVYKADDLKVIELITPEKDALASDNIRAKRTGESSYIVVEGASYAPLGLDFIPVVAFPVDELIGSAIGESEVDDLREQNDVLNTMNEDAIDSLKFEMFPMTAVFNTPPGTAEKLRIAPGAVLEASSSGEGRDPDVKKIESGFRWKDAFKDQYMRVKGAMHEISGLPQIVPQELNFGGLNGEALRILFHDIISDTEEHWLTWEYGLEELHEKSIRYLQARLDEPKFAYDKEIISKIDDYENDILFKLPLPDNRKDLVGLLADEMANELESQAGAMERLGVDSVIAKKAEIDNEKLHARRLDDPYGEEEPGGPIANIGGEADGAKATENVGFHGTKKTRIGPNGEKEETCPTCNGSGVETDPKTKGKRSCTTCQGNGWVQARKR